MFTTIILRSGLFFFMIIAISCNVNRGNASHQKTQMKDTLVYTGCQEKIILKTGSTVEIRLEAIQGTGYQWILKEPSPLLQQLGSDVLEYSSPENRENMVGQAGFQILRFKALNIGIGEVLLEYKRTFEEQVEKSCRIKIEVE
jgi:predicted secreted protein